MQMQQGKVLAAFRFYRKGINKIMTEILYQEGLTWNKADFRLKIQYSMSVLLIIAGVVLAFLSFFIMHEIGMGVLSASTLFIGSALGIYGIGMMVKNQLVDMQVQVDKKIRDLDRREHEYERKRKYHTRSAADDFSDAEYMDDYTAGEGDREDSGDSEERHNS